MPDMVGRKWSVAMVFQALGIVAVGCDSVERATVTLPDGSVIEVRGTCVDSIGRYEGGPPQEPAYEIVNLSDNCLWLDVQPPHPMSEGAHSYIRPGSTVIYSIAGPDPPHPIWSLWVWDHLNRIPTVKVFEAPMPDCNTDSNTDA
jgi:hypothetical protein